MCVCARAHSIVSASCDLLDSCQAPLSSGISRQEDWSELPFLFQDVFLTQGSNPSLVSPVLASGFFTTAQPGKPVTPLLAASLFPLRIP